MKPLKLNFEKLPVVQKKELESMIKIFEGIINEVYPRLLVYEEEQDRLLTREEIFVVLDATIKALLNVLQRSSLREAIRENLIKYYYSQRKEKYVE